jgi:hypothetical protein
MAIGKTSIDRHNQRYGELEKDRSSWMPIWRQLSEYMLQHSGRFLADDVNTGKNRYTSVIDNTAGRARRVLSAGLMSGATSPARPWFRLVTPDQELMKYHAVRLWLSDCTRILLDIFQRSNTYRTLHMGYDEISVFGTEASVLLDDYKNVIHHYPLTIGEYVIGSDYRGQVDTMYRKFNKSVKNTVQEFGLENCSEAVRTRYDNGNYDTMVPIVHVIEPRLDRDPRRRDNRNMPWRNCYYEYGANEGKYLEESGMQNFRVLASRWVLRPGDTYGHSCGMEALGDTKQLQHQQLRKAEAIDYQTKPPLQIPSSLKNREVDRLPGGVSYVDMGAGPNSKVQSLFNVDLRLDFLLQDIQDVRQRIRESFYTDLFLMLADRQSSRKTATEIAEMHEEKLLMLGPVLERLHNERYDPMIEMTFQRAITAKGPNGEGLLPPPPPELEGQALNVEYVSMLAQAQRAVSTNSIDRYVTNLGMIAQFKPGVLDKFDEDEYADMYADLLGVPPDLIVADNKVALVRGARAEQMKQAQQAQQMDQMAGAAAKLASADTSSKNALTDVTRQFSGYT